MSVVSRGSSPTVKEGFVTPQSILEIVDLVAIAPASPPLWSGYCPDARCSFVLWIDSHPS